MGNLFRLYYFMVLALATNQSAFTQDRWFQIEISIFTNENTTDRLEEQWPAVQTQLAYPENLRRLSKLSDLLLTENLIQKSLNSSPEENSEESTPDEIQAKIRAELISAVGPFSSVGEVRFKLFDFLRDDYLQLPNTESDFQQTNLILERSADHRLLFHALWRQAVVQTQYSIPIYIEGGLAYGNQHELQGHLTIHFNENEDRVVIDTNLWLAEFSIVENETKELALPPIPENIIDNRQQANSTLLYYPTEVYYMQQSREMRSTEFHYLDHPAMGLVILVEPYEVPATPSGIDGF